LENNIQHVFGTEFWYEGLADTRTRSRR